MEEVYYKNPQIKIVQTFWSDNSKNGTPLNQRAGWLSPEYHWMSWALSCHLLRKQYARVELYTDEIGKKILIDILRLPYTDVHIIFDDSFNIHPKLFALAKIKTYSLQREPFIHVDGDIFLWKPFPDSLINAELIASNLEVNLFFNRNILKEMEKNFKNIPKHLKEVCFQTNIFASNAGIIGGSNLSFIKEYCEEAISLIECNNEKLDNVNTGDLNNLIEQVSLFYLSHQKEVTINYYIPKPVDHPLYQDYWRFADVPNVELIHLVGGCKKERYALDHLAKRIRLEYPKCYYSILHLCKKENITLLNQLYNYMNMGNIINEESLQNKSHFLKRLNPKISETTKIDIHRMFSRTLIVIEYYSSQSIGKLEELLNFVSNHCLPNQIREIYDLEVQRNTLFQNLIDQVKKGEIYNSELLHYKETANFFLEPNWINKHAVLKKGVEVFDLNWNWNFHDGKSKAKKLEELFSTPIGSCTVTLTNDLLHLNIRESYHEELDSQVLECLKKPKQILTLLNEIKKSFEDDLSIDNLEYQRLIFDTLKRLAFDNLLTIY